ncbi:MAG: hypothetical protein GW855_12085 [Erythrobacter sp.]|nr:hypothetical protein [Erythrobacter sp.]NCQ62997.1 hypothetical protein [Alphaproteobacteria bacterium]
MIELIEANWLLILLAVLVGFVIAWFLLSGSRKTKVTREQVDEEETSGAKRNQALIDAPPAAAKDPAPPPPAPRTTAPEAAPAPKPKPEPAPAPAPKAEPAEPVAPATAAAGIGGAGAAVDAAATQQAESPKAPAGGADDLTRLKGVGPKLAAQLESLGVTSFAQIAAWSESDIDRIDDQLGRFKGRIRRDDWVEQAKLLASDDTGAFEARFGKL